MSRLAPPITLFLSAIAMRLLSWHSVFQDDGVYPNGSDAYYHIRRIRYSVEHFPDVLRFDPLMNYPEGAQPIWSPAFDWVIAALLRPVPGIEDLDRLMALVVCIPPVVGAATVVLAYFIGLRFYSRGVGILAGAALVVLPGHVFYSELGFVDHHVLVAFMAALMLALAMSLFRETRSRDGDAGDRSGGRFELGASLGLGLTIGGLVLVWPGALLHVGVLQMGLILRLLTASDSESSILWARRFALIHLVACLTVYPFSAGNEWVLWGSRSPVVLSDFQPLYFFAACLCFGLTGAAWRSARFSSGPYRRFATAGAIGLSVLAALLMSIPDLRAGIDDAFSWFTKDEDFQSIVSESLPLFGRPEGLLFPITFLSGFIFLVPVSLPWLAWRSRTHPERLLLIGWGIGLLIAALVQWRFVNTYSVVHALLIATLLDALYQEISPRLTHRAATWAVTVLLIAGVGFAFDRSIRYYQTHLPNIAHGFGGQATNPVGLQKRKRFVADAARFIRQASPPLDEVSYSVLAPWGFGHLLKLIAERPVVQDNFGNDVAPENFRRADEYFNAENESAALDILEPMKTRYVLVLSSGSGRRRELALDSMLARLYQLRGSRGRTRHPDGRRSPLLPAMQHHRLVYQSEPLAPGRGGPFVLLYEIVVGAEVVGRAKPEAEVRAALAIEPRVGRPYQYRSRTRADASGVYRLRVPFSNESSSGDIGTGRHYVLTAGGPSATVFVSESAVQQGAEIEGPTFVD